MVNAAGQRAHGAGAHGLYRKSHYTELTAKCDSSIAGFPHEFVPKNLFDVPKEERDAKLEELYNGPGFSLWLGAYQDVLSDPAANKYVSDFVANKIRQRVKDQRIAELLIPKDHGFGIKRVPLEDPYTKSITRTMSRWSISIRRRSPGIAPRASRRPMLVFVRCHRLCHWLRRDQGIVEPHRHPWQGGCCA